MLRAVVAQSQCPRVRRGMVEADIWLELSLFMGSTVALPTLS